MAKNEGKMAPLTPEELEERRKEALKVLESSYDMYEMSREETIETRKKKVDKDGNRIYTDKSIEDTIELMDTMQEDIITKYAQLGGNPEDLKKRKRKKRNNKAIKESVERVSAEDAMEEYKHSIVEEAKKRETNKYTSEKNVSNEETDEKKDKRRILDNVKERSIDRVLSFEEMTRNNGDFKKEPEMKIEVPEPVREGVNYAQAPKPNVNFDEVSLPSKGECYASKMDKIRVSHLVAYDENLILSPGLYKNGTFLDHILKNKILDNINPDDLIQGDRDAIIIWLRAGGYGPMYPIRMTDEKTGTEFETEVDLSKLNFRKFTLKGDENGYFDFETPSGDKIKFKFLTAGDAKKINKMREEENNATMAGDTRDKIRDVIDFIEKSDELSDTEKSRMKDDLSDIEDLIYERYQNVEDPEYTHDMTNRMIMSTISVNGITDRKYVANFVANMNLKDASEYRKYILDNEPGIDYNIKVKRPDSLGGGYVETFLRLDQFIFVY